MAVDKKNATGSSSECHCLLEEAAGSGSIWQISANVFSDPYPRPKLGVRIVDLKAASERRLAQLRDRLEVFTAVHEQPPESIQTAPVAAPSEKSARQVNDLSDLVADALVELERAHGEISTLIQASTTACSERKENACAANKQIGNSRGCSLDTVDSDFETTSEPSVDVDNFLEKLDHKDSKRSSCNDDFDYGDDKVNPAPASASPNTRTNGCSIESQTGETTDCSPTRNYYPDRANKQGKPLKRPQTIPADSKQPQASLLKDTVCRIRNRLDEIYRSDPDARSGVEGACNIDELAQLINAGRNEEALKKIVKSSQDIEDVLRISAAALDRAGGVNGHVTNKLRGIDYLAMCTKYAATSGILSPTGSSCSSETATISPLSASPKSSHSLERKADQQQPAHAGDCITSRPASAAPAAAGDAGSGSNRYGFWGESGKRPSAVTRFVDNVLYEGLLDGRIYPSDFSSKYEPLEELVDAVDGDHETTNENARRFLKLLTRTLLPASSVLLKVAALVALAAAALNPLSAGAMAASALAIDTMTQVLKSRLVRDMLVTFMASASSGQALNSGLSNRYVRKITGVLLHEIVTGTIRVFHVISGGGLFRR